MGLLDLIRGNQISATKGFATDTNATNKGLEPQTVAKIAIEQPAAPERGIFKAYFNGVTQLATEAASDQYCWPQSVAMNSGEISLFQRRLEAYIAKGLDEPEAEALVDRLVSRDRDLDDRISCYECSHLKGYTHLRCNNWRAAGISTTAEGSLRDKGISLALQRCNGFSSQIANDGTADPTLL